MYVLQRALRDSTTVGSVAAMVDLVLGRRTRIRSEKVEWVVAAVAASRVQGQLFVQPTPP